MMSEYHITEYARQKILKEVALRAQRLVVDLAWYVYNRSMILAKLIILGNKMCP